MQISDTDNRNETAVDQRQESHNLEVKAVTACMDIPVQNAWRVKSVIAALFYFILFIS